MDYASVVLIQCIRSSWPLCLRILMVCFGFSLALLAMQFFPFYGLVEFVKYAIFLSGFWLNLFRWAWNRLVFLSRLIL